MENPESVAGIVFSPDRSAILLILRRDVPVWVLPGGGIEPGEMGEESVIREILEETGLTVKIDRLVGQYYPINRLTKRTLLYACSPVSGELGLSEETRGVKFISLNKLPKMPPPYADWVQDALTAQETVSKHLNSVTYLKLLRYLVTNPILVSRFLLARVGLTINSR
jgi:8-oxo-dGTP diphosphatase